ncbi:MAG: NCS2 family permease [bacterium]
MLEKIFKIRQHESTIRKEFLSGITTFMSLAYIIFVNPAILSAIGMPFETAMAATCFTAGICSIMMGTITNLPFVLAPTIGLNSILVYSICIKMNLSWQTGMAIILVEGIIISFTVLTRVRNIIMEAIPIFQKKAIVVGIGLFLIFMGFKNAGIIVAHPITMISQGSFNVPATVVALIGLIVTIFLVYIGIRSAFLLSIILTTVIGLFFGVVKFPSHLFGCPVSPFAAFGECIPSLGNALKIGLWGTILAFLISDFFDTIGNIIGLSTQARIVDKEGTIPKQKQIFFIDSLGTIIGALFGAGTTTTCIESASGIIYGGKTGLTSIFCGLLFISAIFLTPVVEMIGGGCQTSLGYLYPITAPVLIISGLMLMRAIVDIPWADLDEAFPAFLIIFTIPFTFSIANGIGWGIISYTLIKLFTGKIHDIHPAMIVLSLLFVVVFSPIGR